MQTLITGTPGAGKTLYAIQSLILPMLGQEVTYIDADGETHTVKRRLFTNIKGFQIDHELVEAGPGWDHGTKGGWSQPDGSNKKGWHNWHEWAPVGAILVVDEFQRIWPKRANGSPVPPDVSAMDTHRHMGVDFILITQKFSFDGHIEGLIGRHLHVRRIAMMPLAIVYEWDEVSKSRLYSKAIQKRPFRYDKKVYQLYHSADAHTKQPRKVPTLVYVVLAALAFAAYQVPNSWQRITGKGEEYAKRTSSGKTTTAAPADRASAAPHGLPGPLAAASAPSVAAAVPAGPVHMGCIASASRCECFGQTGERINVEENECREASHRVSYVLGGYGASPHGERSAGYPLNRPEPVSSVPSAPSPGASAPVVSERGHNLKPPMPVSSS